MEFKVTLINTTFRSCTSTWNFIVLNNLKKIVDGNNCFLKISKTNSETFSGDFIEMVRIVSYSGKILFQLCSVVFQNGYKNDLCKLRLNI